MAKIAVIKTGGKQYVVTPKQTLKIEKIEGDKNQEVEFKEVLLVGDIKTGKTEVGDPYVDSTLVRAKILEQGRAKKVTVLKYKPKVRYRKKRGHRQMYTKVQILDF